MDDLEAGRRPANDAAGHAVPHVFRVEQLVEPGEIDPDRVHLPGVYVHRIVEVGRDIEKRIERRTITQHPAATEGA